jgi:hypothetical protein
MKGFAGQKNKTPLAIKLTVGCHYSCFGRIYGTGSYYRHYCLHLSGNSLIWPERDKFNGIMGIRKRYCPTPSFSCPLISALINGLWLVAGGIFIALLIHLFLN